MNCAQSGVERLEQFERLERLEPVNSLQAALVHASVARRIVGVGRIARTMPSAAFLEIWPAPDSCDPKAARWL